MDPFYEQRLRDEVIYLHSLWHQGPPRPSSAVAARHHHHLPPTQTTHFKKPKKPTTNPNDAVPQQPNPWPCPAPPPPPAAVWPSFDPKPDPKPISLSPEEQPMMASRNANHHALKAVRKFFCGDGGDDDTEEMDTSDDEDDELTADECGREEYAFFFRVFEEDKELREYYVRSFGKGEFTCLLCGALGGKKTGKKFRSCLALVQHSVSTNAKKKRAHRAYAQAVCKVLGWDIDRLRSIASSLSDKSGEASGSGGSGKKESLVTFVNNAGSLEGKNDEKVPRPHATEVLLNGDGDMGNGGSEGKESSINFVKNVGSVEGHIVEGKNDEAVPESGHDVTETLHNGDEGDMGSGGSDNKQRPVTFVNNAGSVEGKNDEEVLQSGPNVTKVLLNGNEGDMLEDSDMAHPHNVEDTAAEGSTIRVNEESPIKFVSNASSIEGKNDEAVPESGNNVAGVLVNDDEGDMNSLTLPDAGEKLEDSNMVHPPNVEEPAAESSNIVNIVGTVYPDKVEETAPKESAINSSICPSTDENFENPGMVHPSNVVEPATEGLTINKMVTKNIIAKLNKNDCLNGDNFHNWCFRIRLVLEEHDVVHLINQVLTDPGEGSDDRQYKSTLDAYRAWEKADSTARGILISSMSDDFAYKYKDYKTTHELWTALNDNLAGTSVARLRQLTIKFDTYKMNSNHTVKQHLREMSRMIKELSVAGHNLTNEQQVQAVIRSLPDSWEHMKVYLTHNEGIRTFEDVVRRVELADERLSAVKVSLQAIVAEGSRKSQNSFNRNSKKNKNQKGKKSASTPEGKANNFKKKNNVKNRMCYNCGQKGHYVGDCSEPKKSATTPEDNANNFKKQNNVKRRTCYNCGQKGHYAGDCFETKKEQQTT